jgi:hypothetical protein
LYALSHSVAGFIFISFYGSSWLGEVETPVGTSVTGYVTGEEKLSILSF